VIAFIAQIEHISQFEAAQHLVDRYHLQIPEQVLRQATPTTTPQEKDNYFELCQAIATWCHKQLQKNKTANQYLEQRGIDQTMISKFMLGYFPAGSAVLKQLLEHVAFHKAIMQNLIHAGIVFESKQGLFSPFEQRIIFPIYDHLGRCCGFGGRIFLPDDERPKYYNSKENEFFQKGTLLFGLDKAKKNIQAQNKVILVEGYTDCITMHKYGYTNAVATLGTACTVEHLKQLQRYAHQLIAMYDGDQAGQKAMLRLAELCWNVDLDIKILELPAQEDPASYLQKYGSIDMNSSMLQDIFSFFLDALTKNYAYQNLKEKMHATSLVVELIQKINDPLKRDILLLQASEKLQIPLEILRNRYTKHKGTILTEEQETISSHEAAIAAIPFLEQRLFSAILHNKALMQAYDIKSLLPTMQDPLHRILKCILDLNETSPSLDSIMTQLSKQDQALANRLLCAFPAQQNTTEFEQLLDQFHKKHWKSIILHIKMKLLQAQQSNNKEETQRLIAQFQSLKEKFIKYGRLH
jgi:DNA primase